MPHELELPNGKAKKKKSELTDKETPFQGAGRGKESSGLEVAVLRKSTPSLAKPSAGASEVVGTCWLMTRHRGNIYQVTQVRFIIKFPIFFLPGPPGFCLLL